MHTFKQMCGWLGACSFARAPMFGAIAEVCVDSRAAREKSLFVALKGEEPERDGHRYLAHAARCGAHAICIDRNYQGELPANVGVLRVDNTLVALQELARCHLASVKARVIAVSGSVGKTSTAHLLGQISRPHMPVALSRGNQNGQIGLPLSILNELESRHRWMILEMGIDRAGQLARLVEIAPPEIALLTTLEPVHMHGFATLRALARAKGEIFSAKTTRIGLLNAEMRYLKDFLAASTCPKELYSDRRRSRAHLQGRLLGDEVVFTEKGRRWTAPCAARLAPHQLKCLLAAVSAARQMPLTPEQIASSCEHLTFPEGRFTRVVCDEITLIDDTYNASAISVMGALRSLPAPKPGGRRFAVLAQMEELGTFTASAHKQVGRCAAQHLDGLICLEPMHSALFAACETIIPVWRAQTQSAALALVQTHVQSGDVLLLKGSRKWKLDELIEPIVELVKTWGRTNATSVSSLNSSD